MLAVVALAGAAALTVGCAALGPGAPSDPGSPPVAITGADPVPIEDGRLQADGLFDEVSEQGVAVRWAVPGESIAVFVGGSGSGGGCIPQPHAAGLEPDAPSVVVRFDPPEPELMCTMDFRLHGWELGLAEPIDAGAAVPVRIVNLQGDDAAVDLELAPDAVLPDAGGTADPQPSEIPGSGEAPAPTPIPAEQLPDAGILSADQVAVRWIEPGRTLAVLTGGSGIEACVPQPTGATATGPGMLEIAFAPATATTCTDDLVLYGWQVTLPEAVSATLPVEVALDGATASGTPESVTVAPEDVIELG